MNLIHRACRYRLHMPSVQEWFRRFRKYSHFSQNPLFSPCPSVHLQGKRRGWSRIKDSHLVFPSTSKGRSCWQLFPSPKMPLERLMPGHQNVPPEPTASQTPFPAWVLTPHLPLKIMPPNSRPSLWWAGGWQYCCDKWQGRDVSAW